MKKTAFTLFAAALLFSASISSCGESKKENTPAADTLATVADIKEQAITYADDTTTLNGFVAYDAAGSDKLPVIIIVHEWWGLNDYVKNRAKQLAGLGYFALAVDMYGDGKQAANPDEAQKMATPFYMDPAAANRRIAAAIEKAKTFDRANTGKMVAIGYCFGGSMVLNAARSGMDFDGVVSFHGGLAGVTPQKDKIKAEVLVCHGAADQFVPAAEVTRFKMQMDSVGAKYVFKEYAGATHAFTNPDATENGKKFNLPIAYNEKADKASWEDFMAFLDGVMKK